MSLRHKRSLSLVLSLLIIFSMVLSACGGGDEPEPAADTPSEEAAPAAEEAAAAEEEAAEEMMEVDLSPGEFPEPQLIVGSRPVAKLPLDQIVTYKSPRFVQRAGLDQRAG